ncbi:MAG: hypothetical protein HYU69_11085 [Bacteroidetes bacterium]|nr:hypothetical protein [Bacteroidota bacterium]
MIVQFELNDLDALPYTIRSTYRSLLKGERLYKFENAILQFLRKDLPKADHKSELIHAFKKLSGIIREISKDPFEKNAMGEFDFISWLESKIENRPFAEIIRNKVKQ